MSARTRFTLIAGGCNSVQENLRLGMERQDGLTLTMRPNSQVGLYGVKLLSEVTKPLEETRRDETRRWRNSSFGVF